MEKKYCLFSAPYAFLEKELKNAYSSLIHTKFSEIWEAGELKPDGNIKAWIVNPGQRFVVDDDILEKVPSLEVLITPSTGVNHINLESCSKRSISVYGLLDDRQTLNTITASSEFSFLLLLNTLRRLDVAVNEVSSGRWRQQEDLMRGLELFGRSVGLVGLGRIGQNLARWCTAFNANVSYFDPYVDDNRYKRLSLEELFSSCDVICVCCTLSDETTGMINESVLTLLKKGACFVNTSRGEIINEEDLVKVLEKRNDLSVGLDVLSGEVKKAHLKSKLIDMHKSGKIVVTPHIAGATVDSQTKAASGALNLLQDYLGKREPS